MAKLKADAKIMASLYEYARLADGEISGLGYIGKDGVFSKIYPLQEQVCSQGATAIDEKALAEMVSKNQIPNVWWHSHAYGECFWSGTDETTISTVSALTKWLVSIVINKADKYKARIDYASPIPVSADIEIEIVNILSERDKERIREEVKEKVKVSQIQRFEKPNLFTSFTRSTPIMEEDLNRVGWMTNENGIIVKMSKKQCKKWLKKYRKEIE